MGEGPVKALLLVVMLVIIFIVFTAIGSMGVTP